MKFFNVFVGILGFFAILFIVSLFFPRKYLIKKSITIDKSVNETFDYLNNIKNWNDWSPWNTDLDSTLTFFYSKKDTGTGAVQYFRGNQIGMGSFKITNSQTNSVLAYTFNLHFNEANFISGATFYFEPTGNNTLLSWIDSGDVGYNPLHRFMLPAKIKSTEAAFAEGLNNIKKAAESK